MTIIDDSKKYCTLINVFTVEPAKQHELFELLKTATEEVMSKLPGYISANLHVSHDGKTVTNYAQWETLEDFQNMMKDPGAQKHMKAVGKIASDFKPQTYQELWSHTAKDWVTH